MANSSLASRGRALDGAGEPRGARAARYGRLPASPQPVGLHVAPGGSPSR
jgi:hypothetical protein